MAISANAVWEIRTGGDDSNGGAFVTGASGTDFSQQAAKRQAADVTNFSTTDAVANGTTTITSATANFTAALIGNVISLQGGTGALAKTWRQVTAVGGATSITVDAAVAAGTGITMNIGGALASIGMVGSTSAAQGGNIVWVKNDGVTFSITSASTNVSGGCFSRGSAEISIIGYETTRGDFGTGPLLQASGISSFTMITGGVANSMFANLRLDGIDAAGSRGISMSGGMSYKVLAEDFTNNAFQTGAFAACIQCRATSCSSQPAFNGVACIECVAESNTANGFSNFTKMIRCIARNNTGGTTDGFIMTTSDALISNCVAYGNGRDGFRLQAQVYMVNCVAVSNTGTGFNANNAASQIWQNCAAFGNGTNFNTGTGKVVFNLDSITLTADPFTNPGAGDFSLNSDAGGGADLKGAGYPGVMPGGTTTGFMDVGVVQGSSSGGGGGGGGGRGGSILGDTWG